MNKLHETTVPMYGITMMFCQNRVKFCEHFSIEDTEGFAGMCYSSQDSLVIGVFIDATTPHNKKMSNLAHECYHAVSMITYYIGLEINQHNDEAGAYLLSWLMGYCLSCIDRDSSE